METIQIFHSEQFGDIRTAGTPEQPTFCISEVCKTLGPGNTSQTKSRLKKEGITTNDTPTKGIAITDTLTDGVVSTQPILDRLGRKQNANSVNEDGLYDGVVSTDTILDNLGRNQLVNFVNEDGLYDVILESCKIVAKQFCKRVSVVWTPCKWRCSNMLIHIFQ